MKHIHLLALFFIQLFFFVPVDLMNAQELDSIPESLRKDAVKTFINCQRCDMNYIRKEIPYVNYVRDVREAEVYVLETRQSTGRGGVSIHLLLPDNINMRERMII